MTRTPSVLILVALALSLGGCAVDTEVASQSSYTWSTRRVLLCQQGLSDRTTEWDKGLFDLCESVEDAGFELVWDGDFPAFGALDEDGAYDALFDMLDTNDDGLVDTLDQDSAIHLVGFSWGGINVTDIANRLRVDGRVLPSRRRVSAMVLLDPFQPQVSRSRIPANVSRAWVYRQTDTTSGDCSMAASLGFGFNGHRPKAMSAKSACKHYDLDLFLDGVGHCDVPTEAAAAAYENLVFHRDHPAWSAWAETCSLD